MLYNPVNANLGESTNDSNNKFISTPSISEITENAKNTPIENKTMENEVIKSAEKPIINVKPEEIKMKLIKLFQMMSSLMISLEIKIIITKKYSFIKYNERSFFYASH